MASMFEVSNQANIDDARVGFHAAFLSQLENGEADPIEQLARTIPSTTAVEEWDWLGDLPGFQEWKGDRKLGDIDAFKLRIANRDWASGLRLHQNNIKDDKLGLFAATTPELARVARYHRYDLMVQALLNGFAGTAYPDAGNGLAYDGAFFFSDSHTSSGGPNQSNKMTTALSAAGLATARLKLRSMKTADGARPLNQRGTHLIVGPKNEELAEKLMSQDFVATAAGTAAESNIHKGKYKVLVSPRIEGDFDDYWFLADLSAVYRPLIFQLRQEIEPSSTPPDSLPRFMRGELWFGAEARYAVGYFAWQTIVGSAVA